MIPRFGDGRDWFFQKRFGLFVHWGLYAIPAWHEQIQWRQRIPRRDYEPLIREFNPIKFNPDIWLDMAQAAGMEYIVLTTKHHDGFCLWDTAQTDFNIMQTPYRRDIVGLLAEACHRRGLPLGLYYSVVDWHHPCYPNQNRSHELAGPEPGDTPDLEAYLAFLRKQVRELCTNYGDIHAWWWDMNVTERLDPSINAMIRSLQPKAMINGRGFDAGDFSTPERELTDVDSMLAFKHPTEACNSLGTQSWGYRRDEDYYVDRYLMQAIDNALAKGGNYLLNIGPQADGLIPDAQVQIIERIGRWYNRIREAFDGAEPCSAMTENRRVLLTRRGTDLYVHFAKPPESTAINLKPISVLPRRATLLNTGIPVETDLTIFPMDCPDKPVPYLRLRNLPVNEVTNVMPVVKLEFDSLPA